MDGIPDPDITIGHEPSPRKEEEIKKDHYENSLSSLESDYGVSEMAKMEGDFVNEFDARVTKTKKYWKGKANEALSVLSWKNLYNKYIENNKGTTP